MLINPFDISKDNRKFGCYLIQILHVLHIPVGYLATDGLRFFRLLMKLFQSEAKVLSWPFLFPFRFCIFFMDPLVVAFGSTFLFLFLCKVERLVGSSWIPFKQYYLFNYWIDPRIRG